MNVQFSVENGIAFTEINGVKGTLRQMDFEILKKVSQTISDNGIYIETGSYLGCSAVIIGLCNSNGSMIYCHDIWEVDMNNLSNDGAPPPLVENYFYKFYENVRNNNLEKRIIPIRGDSKWSLGIHKDNTVDLAFIDGDHSYEGITNDLKSVWPKMKHKGYILCHDCSPNTETLQGLTDFCKEKNITINHFIGTDMKMIQVTVQ